MVPVYFSEGTKVRIKDTDHYLTTREFGYNGGMREMKGIIFKISDVLHDIDAVGINGYTWHISDVELADEHEQEALKKKSEVFLFDSSQL